MGILRADLLTHSQLSNTSGSIQLDGTTDFIQAPSGDAWRIGLANVAHKSVTIEWWIYLNTTSGYHNAFDINYTSGLVMEGVNGVYSVYGGGQTLINEGILDAAVANRWYHYALVIHGGPAATPKSIFLYRDGKLSGAGKIDSNVAIGSNSNNLSIGARQSNGANSLNGYISNFRWSDEVVYNSEFTVPKFNLKARPSTLLLCCQSSTSATEAAVSVTGSVTASGNATHSSFNPGLKDDITDTGVVFDGFGSFATSTYMVPPGGNTRERNRGRAVFGGGESPTADNVMEYINIQSGGRTFEFGDHSAGGTPSGDAVASSTRGVFTVHASPNTNALEFITIANTGNSQDFGDQTTGGVSQEAAASNSTRGLFAGGIFPGSTVHDTTEYITIATLGNAIDFGNLIASVTSNTGVADATRALFAGGIGPSSPFPTVNRIEYFTIANTGNATDFGDLTFSARYPGSAGDSTRGVFMGGATPSAINTICFVTIQTTGNATDYGDLVTASHDIAATSNNTRAIMGGGGTPSRTNTIEQLTIQTAGNALDFGDLSRQVDQLGVCSDSHGGIS